MKHYRDVYENNPYIHNERPNIYIWRLHTPTGKPASSLAAAREGYMCWYATSTKKTAQELETFSPDETGVRKGYSWHGPFIYRELSK